MKALIIDGNRQNGHLVEAFLSNQGFPETSVIYHTNDLEGAIEIISSHHFQLIIIDPSFSREFGLPLIKTVKDFSPSTTIIAFSLCSIKPCASTCRQQCSNQGADWHLDKIRQFDLLPAMVRKSLNLALVWPDNLIAPKKTLSLISR